MFSAEYYAEIEKGFAGQMALLDERIRGLAQKPRVSEAPGAQCLSAQCLSAQCLSELSARLLREKKEEILRALAQCTKEEAQALTFLYSAMPISDLLDYPASLFFAYAKHGVFLWEEGPFAGRVPEKLFANYVLHYRVNNEDIADTRGFFYDCLKNRINKRINNCADNRMDKGRPDKEGTDGKTAREGSAMYDAVVEINYWCAEEATYRSTDARTQNPRTMYRAGIGRCGEESALAVTALRSMGIPARQVYAPLWSHCDDNHAWVEVWCDGEWFFLGACEPEQRLNLGWFNVPASRAMMVHSKWFGGEEPEETAPTGRAGMAKVLNHLERYARTVRLTVKTVDEKGRPVPWAKVDFQVLNQGSFGSVAVLYTGAGPEDCGAAQLRTGFGDLYVTASACRGDAGTGFDAGAEILYGESLVSLRNIKEGEEAHCTIVLKSCPECRDGWKELDFHAPAPCPVHEVTLTQEQKLLGERRFLYAEERRRKKTKEFYDSREAERALRRFDGEERALLEDILHNARGNMAEVVRFVEWDAVGWIPAGWQPGGTERWKLEVLKSLREKDYWDLKADVLTDCCINALPHAGKLPDEIFFRYLLCPRVADEMLRPCRAALENGLEDAVKEAIRREPERLVEIVDGWMLSLPEREYGDLITSPLGCLRGGIGSRHSRDVFCVNLYRSLGIPARLNRLDGRMEYYRDGRFKWGDALQAAEKPDNQSAGLILCGSDSLKLSDWEHYSVERFEDGGFRRLWLEEELHRRKGHTLELDLKPGCYRILTVNRLQEGEQLAKMAVFTLEKGERRTVELSVRELPLDGMLSRVEIADFALRTLEGNQKLLSALAGGGKALFLWLEVTREPTEHILNELYDRREEFVSLDVPMYVVVRAAENLEDATLRRTLTALPVLAPLLDDFGEDYKTLAESLGQEAGKLPLAMILEGGRECVYSDAGYNVGLADTLGKILRFGTV